MAVSARFGRHGMLAGCVFSGAPSQGSGPIPVRALAFRRGPGVRRPAQSRGVQLPSG